MNVFYQPHIEDQFELAQEETHHALRVLRLQPGEKILVTDGKGTLAEAVIDKTTKTLCHCRVAKLTKVPPPSFSFHLAIAPTKNTDRMEWLVEKCVEIGISEISFMRTQHSERKRVNSDRLLKVAISAMKQSQQAWLPRLNTEVDFDSLLALSVEQKFIAHVDATNPVHLAQAAKAGKNTLVLIGPEGDFTNEELTAALKHGFVKVSLGANRLRTETAGLVACCLLNSVNA